MDLNDCGCCPRGELVDTGAIPGIDNRAEQTGCIACYRADCHECINS